MAAKRDVTRDAVGRLAVGRLHDQRMLINEVDHRQGHLEEAFRQAREPVKRRGTVDLKQARIQSVLFIFRGCRCFHNVS